MKEKIKIYLADKNTKLLLAAILFSGLLVLLIDQKGSTSNESRNSSDLTSTDTIIPSGFVLVPIEIQNIDSLSSLIGNFGVVDLFTTPQLNQKSGVCVGKRLKLLRAPLNPNQFAVLVPENEAHEILESSGPFTAVVQNPQNSLDAQVIKKSFSRSKVEYLKGTKNDK